MKITIAIPCYNECDRVGETVKKIIDYHKSDGNLVDLDILFINDGSIDNTQEVLNSISHNLKESGIQSQIIAYPLNKGKGFAVKTALNEAIGDFILLYDADASTPITELDKLLPLTNGYDLIIGSRKQIDSKIVKYQSSLRTFLGKSFSFVSGILLSLPTHDFTCGFKLIRKEPARLIAQRMSISRWAYDAELLKIAQIRGVSTKEIGIVWINNESSKVRLERDVIGSFRDLLIIFWRGLFGYYEK